ncbi:MAG: hypothetical protein GY732_09680, partial [Gammaproteobacteria bacterium]|nr:hypothetical protein [Gammaproteobacteria bacterium]
MKIRLRGLLKRPVAAEGCLDQEALAGQSGQKQTHLQLIKTLKNALREADACLARKFEAGDDVNQLVKARAWVVDQLILYAWHALIP